MVSALSAVLNHVNSTTETFVTAYYSAWDNDRATLGELYRPTSRIVWNGNPISGRDEMASLVEKMPASKHDIQAFDSHPLPGTGEANLTTIIITVSGTVQFYNASEGAPSAPPPKIPGSRPQRSGNTEDVENLPRQFSHSFVLSPERSPQGTMAYAVQSETFRFVG